MFGKLELRKEMFDKRLAMSPGERLETSCTILDNLERLDGFRRALDILFYLSLEEEVQTDDMIVRVIENGRRVYVPLVDRNLRKLRVTRIFRMNIEFEGRAFGIREPTEEFLDLCNPDELDLVIVPGLAFDLTGARVGFGAGYFDRFLAKLEPNVVFIGLAFDFQIVDAVPQSINDRKVDYIVTDKRIHDCRHPLIDLRRGLS